MLQSPERSSLKTQHFGKLKRSPTCKKCGKEQKFVYLCSKCGAKLCKEHRKPEHHDCTNKEIIMDALEISQIKNYFMHTSRSYYGKYNWKKIYQKMRIKDEEINKILLEECHKLYKKEKQEEKILNEYDREESIKIVLTLSFFMIVIGFILYKILW